MRRVVVELRTGQHVVGISQHAHFGNIQTFEFVFRTGAQAPDFIQYPEEDIGYAEPPDEQDGDGYQLR
jgi:hypothetical protein